MSRACLPLAIALASALALAACDRKTSSPAAGAPGESAPSASAAPAASPAASHAASPAPTDSTLAILAQGAIPHDVAPEPAGSASAGQARGPAPAGSASADEREKALALLLTGNSRASELPEAASAPGLGFDASLRKRLTTVEIEQPGSSPSHSVQVRAGEVSASGKLPVEVIKRIVRQNLGRVRMCYEMGLRRNPTLQGRVTVKFVIGADGSVQSATSGGTDLADPESVQCIVRTFHSLSFPTPESGIVTVSYPISLSPGS